MIDQLLREAIEDRVDAKKWRAAKARERKNKSVLAAVLQRWDLRRLGPRAEAIERRTDRKALERVVRRRTKNRHYWPYR